MNNTTLLRELSSHLLNLASICSDKSQETSDREEAAWLSGSARGYIMAAQIITCRADELQIKYLADKAEHEHAGNCRAADSHN